MGRRETWDAAQKQRLTELWAQDDGALSTGEIGRRMGFSKNAIVGKAHRLGLPSRPSPIIRAGAPRPPRPRRAPPADPTLPPLPSAAAPAPIADAAPQVVQLPETTVTWFGDRRPMREKPGRRIAIRGVTLAQLPSAVPAKVPAPAPVPAGPRGDCRWPMWGDRERARDAERAGRKLWCGEPVRLKRDANGDQVPCVYCAEHAKVAFTRVAPYGAMDKHLRWLADHPPQAHSPVAAEGIYG
jgi:hypothetical protein